LSAVAPGLAVTQLPGLTAIAAVGMTSLKSLADMGLRPVMLPAIETLLPAAMVLGAVATR
jgi:hypothetical protein